MPPNTLSIEASDVLAREPGVVLGTHNMVLEDQGREPTVPYKGSLLPRH
jgi:hypothetical protein